MYNQGRSAFFGQPVEGITIGTGKLLPGWIALFYQDRSRPELKGYYLHLVGYYWFSIIFVEGMIRVLIKMGVFARFSVYK